jgi:hypothetical protein
MSLSIQTVAQEFSLSEEALTRESLRAYLLEQLHTLDLERQARCAKFGVTSLAERRVFSQPFPRWRPRYRS